MPLHPHMDQIPVKVKKHSGGLEWWWMLLTPALGKQRQMKSVSLRPTWSVNYRTARATQDDPVTKK